MRTEVRKNVSTGEVRVVTGEAWLVFDGRVPPGPRMDERVAFVVALQERAVAMMLERSPEGPPDGKGGGLEVRPEYKVDMPIDEVLA